ncbi:polysaccharide polymerase [Paenibacillus sp. FSL R7-269]|uniref:EpsG family protein n=1 Tax=Paenibacillus sp. FSL R7-269 TaxID=1226755 RepID=UPI0003E22E2D|nr:polysaccharide polymerase [Paenibacillus sp. FSL R7-269]
MKGIQMITYIFVNLMIIASGAVLELINSKDKLNTHRNKTSAHVFLILSFTLLLAISSFRGSFTTDYTNYVYLFERYNQYGFFDVFRVGFPQEKGYIFLNRLIGLFTSNPLYLFITVSFVTLYGFYSQIRKYSIYVSLSVIMFVTVGSYYTSFNTMRQILAVSIIFAGSKFLYDRKLLKYCLVVILAAFFHKSSLIMIPFFFILNLKIKFKNLVIVALALVLSTLYLDSIITFIQRAFYSVYTNNVYGTTGFSFKNAFLPIMIMIFCLFNYKKIDLNNTINKIWMNAVIFYAFFSILGLKVQLTQRISEFFAPYALLLIPLIFSKIKNNALKGIYLCGLMFFLILYNYVTLNGTGYDPYYFIWDILHW